MNIKVLILGGGLQALSTACSLKREGYYTICCASRGDVCQHSRFVDNFVPISYIDNNIYPTDLLSTIHQFDIKVIIPMSDKSAEYLSIYKDVIEQNTQCKCAAPDINLFYKGADKASLMAFCEQHNFPHPKTYPLSVDTLAEATRHITFPALIKPNHSVGARGITYVTDKEELEKKLIDIQANYGETTLQEYVDTTNMPYYNVMLYRNAQGIILGQTVIEILRFYPIKGGSSSFCRTVEKKDLLDICIKLLDKLNWVGMADFDVLVNTSREYKIIELNPRVPASLRAADIAGVNFPHIIVCDLLQLPIPRITYKTGLFLRYLGLDILWFLKSPQRFKAKPSWFLFLGKKTFFQDIYATDPTTWWNWFTHGFQRYLNKIKHHQH